MTAREARALSPGFFFSGILFRIPYFMTTPQACAGAPVPAARRIG